MLKKSKNKQALNRQKLIEKKSEQKTEDDYKKLKKCIYCGGRIVKRGRRKKKYETIQIYYCKKCERRFTSLITKHKTYPLKIVIECISLYNRLYPLANIPEIIQEKYGISITSRTISSWIREYKKYMPFLRMREFASKKYSKKDIVEEARMIHKQIYDFKYHRAKMDMILSEEFRHFRFKPLQEFLELAFAECPNQIFQNPVKRSSEFKKKFNLDQVKISSKNNAAVKIAGFIMQAVSNNKLRHETLQDFMLSNDSVTVAVEVPVLLDWEDIKHFNHELNFEIPVRLNRDEHITGHIDLVQIRNGHIYVMDFKPSAAKAKPIEQLTLYALALSRLTGLRLYHFRCAWFDDKDYYEFFPLHVVYKINKKKKKISKDQKKLN